MLAAAAQGTGLLLTALGPAPLSRLAGEALDIPSMGLYLAPAVPTGAFRCQACRSPTPAGPHRAGSGTSRPAVRPNTDAPA